MKQDGILTYEEVIQMLNEKFPEDPLQIIEVNYKCPNCKHIFRMPKYKIDFLCELIPKTNPITQFPMIKCVNCDYVDSHWFLHVHNLNEKQFIMVNVTEELMEGGVDEEYSI